MLNAMRCRRYRERQRRIREIENIRIPLLRENDLNMDAEQIIQDAGINANDNNEEYNELLKTSSEEETNFDEEASDSESSSDESEISNDGRAEQIVNEPNNFLNHEPVGDVPEIEELRAWMVDNTVPQAHCDQLLEILSRRLLPQLPKCASTFLETRSAEYEIQNMNDSDGSIGEFAYIGIEKGLQRYGKRKFYHIIQNWNLLELKFNIDGFTPYNSIYKNMWLI